VSEVDVEGGAAHVMQVGEQLRVQRRLCVARSRGRIAVSITGTRCRGSIATSVGISITGTSNGWRRGCGLRVCSAKHKGGQKIVERGDGLRIVNFCAPDDSLCDLLGGAVGRILAW
jgi:hypothetical protein